MRERNKQINIRVNQTEKEKIHRQAKRCGMSDTEYIRNCALDKPVAEMPREGLQTAYRKINSLIPYLEQYNDTQRELTTLKSVQEILLNLYRGKEVEDDGGDEDLDGNG